MSVKHSLFVALTQLLLWIGIQSPAQHPFISFDCFNATIRQQALLQKLSVQLIQQSDTHFEAFLSDSAGLIYFLKLSPYSYFDHFANQEDSLQWHGYQGIHFQTELLSTVLIRIPYLYASVSLSMHSMQKIDETELFYPFLTALEDCAQSVVWPDCIRSADRMHINTGIIRQRLDTLSGFAKAFEVVALIDTAFIRSLQPLFDRLNESTAFIPIENGIIVFPDHSHTELSHQLRPGISIRINYFIRSE
ncbi:MAG: hypothetical protein WCR58_08895 [Bacteroidales bacterium]|jgi:hypothetical protein|nr:hypothetical protein [Bacteroidales bacterium]MDD3701398.1 hypothetical protein [Bacteroidales bacterium]MDY0369527.1 hypothetical protein [Bacteroidales bacterium]